MIHHNDDSPDQPRTLTMNPTLFPSVSLRRSAVFNTDGVLRAVPWDVVEWDDANFWNAGTPNNIVMPTNGRYLITCGFLWNANVNTFAAIYITNSSGGTTYLTQHSVMTGGAFAPGVNAARELQFNAGNAINIRVISGSNGSIGAASPPRNYVTVQRLVQL